MGGREPVITIDGPAGVGKSTVARRLADRLGYRLVRTGAMYRALTLSVLRAGLPLADTTALRGHLAGVTVSLRQDQVFLDGEDVTAAIAADPVARATSALSALAAVREKVTPLQRALAATGGAVLEGRDTGSVVCPDAEVKFFLTASLDSRARRRRDELAAAGTALPLEAVRREMTVRDVQDTTRALAPLVKPAGAVEIDTTDLGVEEVVGRMAAIVERRRCSTPR